MTGATAAAMVGKTDDASVEQNASEQQDHDHEHQAVPADIALRVKALETVLVEKEPLLPFQWILSRVRPPQFR